MENLSFISALILFLHLVVQSSGTTRFPKATRFPMAKPGCNGTCGGVTIPYPFGVGRGCALNEFYTINCTDVVDDSANGLKPYLALVPQSVSKFPVQVLEISLSDQTVTIYVTAFPICSDQGQAYEIITRYLPDGSRFFFSAEHNKLTLVGCCNVLLTSAPDSPEILAGCTSTCTSKQVTGCYGLNCCQASIPYHLDSFGINITASQNFAPRTCAYALLVDQKWKFQSYFGPTTDRFFPVVLSWALQNYSDIDAISGCSTKSRSLDIGSSNISAYYCECKALGDDTWSYHINPYLDGACRNAISQIRGSRRHRIAAVVGSGVGAGIPLLIIIYLIAHRRVRRIQNNKRKEKVFRRMLQQQLSTEDIQNTKLFTADELSKATDGFNQNRILGQGGQGTVYKGMLTDGRIVAIKKGKNVGKSRFEEFVNEMVILSQVNHRNVVKLLGCCLQTEVPLLIYEFVPNGTLHNLIHSQNDDEFPFTWNLRLRIATEIAGALAYLHSDISVPILHRDVKSSNILLDEKYIGKVSDFGTSRSIEVDKTHLTTRVKGTFGYLDPEYFRTSQYTDRSDVYSFGVVLVELLTRRKPISSIQTEEDHVGVSLVESFLKSMNQNSLMTILDPELDERNEEEVILVAELAQRCLNSNGKARPTMKETHRELERAKLFKVDSTIHAKFQDPSCSGKEALGKSDTTCYTWTIASDTVESASDAYLFMYKTV
ncbi:wall-associated receptor kinase-like 22 [Coffea arabica]|uniref:Wall-associated receptor kinase-like 22 n=1 Tax=Coffea arabica TaxID=13443 RepID=A0A6P6UEX4_COFAR|nr:wall-associated receptor kinase-like 22 [Coffea arabica]